MKNEIVAGILILLLIDSSYSDSKITSLTEQVNSLKGSYLEQQKVLKKIERLLVVSGTNELKLQCQDIIRENSDFGYRKVSLNQVQASYNPLEGSLQCTNLAIK